MKLTPVKIRGKGPRKKAWRPPDPKRLLKRNRGDADIDDVETQQRRKRRSAEEKKKKKKKPTGPPIERLPVEVLEMIFLTSQNLDFPRSSRRIGWLLSGKTTLNRLVERAFAPTWDVWFGVDPRRVQSYYGWRDDWAKCGGDPVFQSGVLGCPWITTTFIYTAQKNWFRRNKRRIVLPPSEDDEPPPPPDEYEVPGRSSRNVGLTPLFDQIFELEWSSHVCWADDLAEQIMRERPSTEPDEFASRIRNQVKAHWDFSQPASLEVNPETRLPESLLQLRGPLNGERIKLLWWLIRQGASLPKFYTWEMGKLAYERTMHLLKDPQLALIALGCLTHNNLGLLDRWPKDVRREKADEAISTAERIDRQGHGQEQRPPTSMSMAVVAPWVLSYAIFSDPDRE